MATIFKHLFLGIAFFFLSQSGTIQAQKLQVKRNSATIESAILKKKVKLYIHLPDDYKDNIMPYGVLYLLNGTPTNAAEITSLTQHFHQYKYTPKMIVVAIDQSVGEIDKLTTKGDATKRQEADSFLSFMEKELIPAIENKYRTNGERLLQGKANFGSFPLYTFLTRPMLFNRYVCASSNWFDEAPEYFRSLANKAFENPGNFKDRRIFLASLNGPYINGLQMHEQMLAFSEFLKEKLGDNVFCDYQKFDDWGLVLHPGVYDGLLYVFYPDDCN